MTSTNPNRLKLYFIGQCMITSALSLLFIIFLKLKFDTLYKDDIIKSFKTTGEREYGYTIITGSSANHLCSLENFLYSLHSHKTEMNASDFPRIVVYNIGLNRTQLPILTQLQQHQLIDQTIQFDHERYPAFWDVAIESGQYGWKTGILNDARIRFGGLLVWLDAGNQVTKEFLTTIPSLIRDGGGFWSPKSVYGMGKWTHPGMFEYFKVDPEPYRHKPNCNGAAIGFDTENATIVQTLILPLFECGLVKACIAPEGSNRENHRQDQAALTFLAYRNGHQCTVSIRDFNFQTHRDQSCRSSLMELDLQHRLYHPSSIDFPKWERVDTIDLYNHPEWKYPENDVPLNIKRPLTPLNSTQ